MPIAPQDLIRLTDVACTAAQAAGALIASYRDREVAVSHKQDQGTLASQVVTEVDELSQELILKHLEPTMDAFDLAVVTEESEDDRQRLLKNAFWCIDPLDGTLPFTQKIPGFSVSIALVAKDGSPLAGVVYDPVQSKLYRATQGQGVMIDGKHWSAPAIPQPSTSKLRFYYDCTFESHPERDTIIEQCKTIALSLDYQGLEVVTYGGGVLNACAVLENPPACYFKKPKLKAGGGSLWDFAATACLFQEANMYARDFEGAPLDLNRKDATFMNHRGICYASNTTIAEALRSML